MTLALKMASSMCFSSDLMTHLMLLTTCWTSGGRLQLECSRNLATNILVSLYIFRSAREWGRSWEECVCTDRGLSWMSTFLPSFCCFLTHRWLGLAPTASVEMSLGSEDKNTQYHETVLEAEAACCHSSVKISWGLFFMFPNNLLPICGLHWTVTTPSKCLEVCDVQLVHLVKFFFLTK